MRYLNFYKNYLQIQNTKFLNGFWFWLRRIPIIGKKLSPSFYGMQDLKTIILLLLKWLTFPLVMIKSSFTILIGWLVAYGVKNFSLQGEEIVWSSFRGDYPDIFHWTLTLFVIFCVLTQVNVLLATGNTLFRGIRFAKMFRLSYSKTLQTVYRIDSVQRSLTYLLPLGILGLLYHQSLVALLLPISFRLVAMNLSIFLVAQKGWLKVLICYRKKWGKALITIGLFLLSLFSLVYMTLIHTFYWTNFWAWFCFGLALLSCYLTRHIGFSKAFIQSIFINMTLMDQAVADAKNNQNTAGFKAAQRASQKIEVTDSVDLFDKFSGIQLLNRLLFKRYQKIFKKKLGYRLGGLGILFIVICAIYGYLIIRFGKADYLSFHQVGQVLPSIFFIMYLIALSKEIVAIYYLKCDQAMLHYPFYRTKQTILRSFVGRLGQLFLVNTLIVAGLFLNVFAAMLLFGRGIPLTFYGLIIVYGIAVNVLFSFHELFLYYLLQPFDQKGQMKNPIFGVIAGLFYFFCVQNYSFANLFKSPILYVMAISAIIVTYMIIGLVIVWRKAPKSFRLK